MQAILSRTLFPVAVFGSFLIFLYTRHVGGNIELAMLLSGVSVVILSTLLERLTPFRQEWNAPQGDLATDLLSTGVLVGLTEPLLKAAAPVALVALYGLTQTVGGWRLFPTALPFLVQVLLAMLIAEFGSYWSHRWHHGNRRLWWLHALHHSSERLYTLNNFRFHPLNHALNYLFGIFPLMLLGVPVDVLLGYLALTQPVLMLQHANLPLRNGILNYVFSTNEVHRWHHSSLPDEGNSNYGRALLLWDMVFGTFRYRPDADAPQRIGLFASSRYPGKQSYVRQLMSMFHPDCCKA